MAPAGSSVTWLLSTEGLVGYLKAIYIALGMLYESLTHPITILSTLPSAGVGALLALLITGMPMSVVAMMALVLMS